MVKLEFIKPENNQKVALGQVNRWTQWIPRGREIDKTRSPLAGVPGVSSDPINQQLVSPVRL